MKPITLALACLLSTGAGAQAPVDSLEKAVMARDRELNELIMRHERVAAGAIYDEDFVLTTAGGGSKSKAQMLAEIGAPELLLEVNETSEVRVRLRGGTAVLTGVLHQKGAIAGKRFDVKLRVTDTWWLSDGHWRLLAGHASLL